MKSLYSTLALLFLILTVAGPQQPATRASSNAAVSPCLSPTPSDSSRQQINLGVERGAVSGSVAPVVMKHQAAYKGDFASNTILNLEFVFKIRNRDAFEACLGSVENPASPEFRNFLNAATLQPYMPTPGARDSVKAFFQNYGFTVTDAASPLVLRLTGSAQQAANVFNVNFGVFSQDKNGTFYSATSDPTLPQNLAGLALAVLGLDNYTTPRPAETPCGPSGSFNHPLCPQAVQVGYSLTGLYSSLFMGQGVNVAIVDFPGDPGIQSAIDTYDLQYGLPSVSINLVYPDGPIPPSSYLTNWAAEAAMDVEAVHTTAPKAGIVLLYDTVDLMNAVDYVAAHNLASIVSNSWTYACNSGSFFFSCSDTQFPVAFVQSVDARLQVDAALGLTVLFASSDQGSRPDGGHIGTEFPSSDPNVLAVGATNLVMTGCTVNSCTSYGGETGASFSGGGYSGFFAEPSWQISYLGAKPGRAVPDVSMIGGTPAFWVYSSFASSCGGGIGGGWFPCFGTSLSTPLWAGFLAIAIQLNGGALGNVAPLIYQLGASALYSSLFHDVVSGSNGDYSATAGWDPVTGWGTPLASNLAPAIANLVSLTFSYSILSGGSPLAPVLHYVHGGSSQTFTLTITPTFVLVDPGTFWSVDPNPLGGSTGNERWFTSQVISGTVAGPLTANLAYQHQYSLTLEVFPSGAGTTSPSSSITQWENAGTLVTIQATPGARYQFRKWVGIGISSYTGTNNAVTIIMNGPVKETAHFEGTFARGDYREAPRATIIDTRL